MFKVYRGSLAEVVSAAGQAAQWHNERTRFNTDKIAVYIIAAVNLSQAWLIATARAESLGIERTVSLLLIPAQRRDHGNRAPSVWHSRRSRLARLTLLRLSRRSGMADGPHWPITVYLNSGGGDAAEGLAIYNALAAYQGKVKIINMAVAGSAASVAFMAGDDWAMAVGAWFHMHDPATPLTDGRGTPDEHIRRGQDLEMIAGSFASIYAEASGNSVAAGRELMRQEPLMLGELLSKWASPRGSRQAPLQKRSRLLTTESKEMFRRLRGTRRTSLELSRAGLPPWL